MLARITQLEELLLAMNLKKKVGGRLDRPTERGQVELQRFRTLDGPVYWGKFQEAKPFLMWIHGMHFFLSQRMSPTLRIK